MLESTRPAGDAPMMTVSSKRSSTVRDLDDQPQRILSGGSRGGRGGLARCVQVNTCGSTDGLDTGVTNHGRGDAHLIPVDEAD
jgi:hypothetical protein